MPRNVTRLHNLPEVLSRRRDLRHHLTKAEAILWGMLKNSKLEGRKFRRQHSVGVYILDFYCPSERLAIELDGSVHFEELNHMHDVQRDRYLSSKRIKVVRIGNGWVIKEPLFVLDAIKKEFGWRSRPPECLRIRGG